MKDGEGGRGCLAWRRHRGWVQVGREDQGKEREREREREREGERVQVEKEVVGEDRGKGDERGHIVDQGE